MNEEHRSDDLPEAEAARFRGLPRERIPPSHLEDRVARALQAQGLLASRPAGRPRVRVGPLAGAAAAGVVLFGAGVATGQWVAEESAAGLVSAVPETESADRAARVQEAGSAYVRAVARLSELAEAGETEGLDPGREAAHVALHAAALELARLSPADPTMRLILRVLEERVRTTNHAGTPSRTVVWF